MIPNADLLLMEERIWLLVSQCGVPIYDFNFRDWFQTRAPYSPPDKVQAVARVGAIANYDEFYSRCEAEGIFLINSPEQYRRATQLDVWYPFISELTPQSVCFRDKPTLEQIKAQFHWPVFMKGARQTSRHQRKLSLIENDEDFLAAIGSYAVDPILKWQDVVCRKFVPLRTVTAADNDEVVEGSKMPRRFEFRTFWWKGKLAGAGRYWWEGSPYNWSENERAAGLSIAAEAARRLDVPFLVVDIAQAATGEWIVIECNDGQESGYAGVSPFGLWQKIVEIEQEKAA